MKILLFNGTLSSAQDTSEQITGYLKNHLEYLGFEVVVFRLAAHDIPFFDPRIKETPAAVKQMLEIFRECDRHIWLTPLYHGGMVGAMKNCLDWLVLSAQENFPYLTSKVVGLICWAYGGNAATGIDALRTIVANLRAWTLPYSIPIVREDLYEHQTASFTALYQERFKRLSELLVEDTLPVYGR